MINCVKTTPTINAFGRSHHSHGLKLIYMNLHARISFNLQSIKYCVIEIIKLLKLDFISKFANNDKFRAFPVSN